MERKSVLFSVLLIVGLLLAACGGPESEADSAGAPTELPPPLPGGGTPTFTPFPTDSLILEEGDEDFVPEVGVESTTDVTFQTEDGVTLTGMLLGSGTTTIILTHMRPTDRTSWEAFAERLAAAGYAALTFDFRGYGDSGGAQDFDVMDQDVLAAVRYVRDELGAEAIIVIGASMGGTYATAAMAEPAVVGVGLISSPNSINGFSVNPEWLLLSGQPKLFVVAADDQPYADQITAMYEQSAGPSEIFLLEGNAHGTFIFDSPQGAELEALLLEFIANNAE